MTKYLKRFLDYCLAVRSALTADGREPLNASGLKLQERLTKIYAKLRTGSEKGGLFAPLIKLKQILSNGLEHTAALWSPIAIAYNWVALLRRFLIIKPDLMRT